jgi:hypothetical protein
MLAVLLLILQVIAVPATATAMAPVPASATLVDILGDQAICHGFGEPSRPGDPAPTRHDCALCPVCHLMVAAMLLPAGGGMLARIVVTPVVQSSASLFAALPHPRRAAARPRGPPFALI